jgi:hypothetical protein
MAKIRVFGHSHGGRGQVPSVNEALHQFIYAEGSLVAAACCRNLVGDTEGGSRPLRRVYGRSPAWLLELTARRARGCRAQRTPPPAGPDNDLPLPSFRSALGNSTECATVSLFHLQDHFVSFNMA